MATPPPGFEDMLGDAETAPLSVGNYHDLLVEEVGIVSCRKPMPNAAANLAMASRADVTEGTRAEHLNRFVRSHLNLGEANRLLNGMMVDDLPADTFTKVAIALSEWGTARPT